MKRYLMTLIPCLALVPLCLIASLCVTVITLIGETPAYRSSATIEGPPPINDQTLDSYSIQAETDIRIATMAEVLLATREAVSRPAEEIAAKLSRIEVQPIRESRLIRFTVDAFDPMFAAEFANAWQKVFIAKMDERERRGYRLVENALPSGAPISPRRVETILRASILGVLSGTLLALLLAGIIVATFNKKRTTGGP